MTFEQMEVIRDLITLRRMDELDRIKFENAFLRKLKDCVEGNPLATKNAKNTEILTNQI